ncbi:MAG: TonB-dependent receptor [Leptospirales bacterium]
MHIFGHGMRKALALGVALLCMDGNTGLALAQADAGQSKQPDQGKMPDAAMPTAIIYGAVVSTKDQTPLQGVPILLKNTQTGEVIVKESDPQGAYIFNHLPAGIYRILVGGGSYSLQKKEGVLKAGMVGEMNFRVAVLSSGDSSLLGSIYEGHGDRKIPLAAQMQIKNVKTHEVYTIGSGPSGTFSLDKIPAGRYLVQVLKKGYLPVSEDVAVNGKTSRNFRLSLNKLASADINADTSKKIKDATGAITVISKKKFEDNQSAGLGWVLNTSPSINYYSRAGMNGLTGGMNFFMCRGYSTGGANANGGGGSLGGSNIQFMVEGVPMNTNQDGGMVYDLNLINQNVASVEVKRGVTTSQDLANYASGCTVNINLVQPSKDPFTELTSGVGSYGLYYTSFIDNTGVIADTNAAAYNDLSVIHNDGFQNNTGFLEYQDYANLTKYLSDGYVKLMFTGAYKNYDRAGSITVGDYNTFGPSYNGAPNYNANQGVNNGAYTPDSPFYHNWISQRYMATLQSANQIGDWLTVKNNAFVWATPWGVNQMPVVLTNNTPGSYTGNASQISNGVYSNPSYPGQYANNLTPQFGGAPSACGGAGNSICMNPFLFQYIQGQGYKAGDILKADIKLAKEDIVHIGARASWSTNQYGTAGGGINTNIGGSSENEQANMSTVGFFAENEWNPIDEIHTVIGFREMFLGVYNQQNMGPSQVAFLNAAYNQGFLKQNQAGGSAGENYALFMPHAGIDLYPTQKWKIYANAGESYSAPATQFYQGISGTPNIPVETLWDFGVGTRYDFSEKGYVALDTYYDNVNNASVFTFPQTNGVGVPDLIPVIAPTVIYKGIEIDGAYKLGYGFSVDANWSLNSATMGQFSSGAISSMGFNMSGQQVPFVPTSEANFDVNWEHGPWHLTVNERFTGDMVVTDVGGNTTNGLANGPADQMTSPAYWVTNLMGTYDLPKSTWYKKASVFVDAYNLLNTNYYNPAGITQAGTPASEQLFVYPGEPINVFGGVSVAF